MRTTKTPRKASKSIISSSWKKHDLDGRAAWVLSVVGYPTRGLNGPNGLMRAHWAALKTYKNEITTLVQTATGPCPPPFTGPVVAHYCRGYRAQPMDSVDNLQASSKPIWDALVRCGFLLGDSPTLLRASHSQRPQKQLGASWQVVLAAEPKS